MNSILAIVIAYLLGSIPSAYYVGKWVKGIDLRTVGSGNLGFTNALRVLGLKWSIPVLIFDILKGSAAVLLALILTQVNFPPFVSGSNLFDPEISRQLFHQQLTAVLSGLAAILGHNWTIFLGFKGGGKGVATTAGVFLALTPVPFLITFAVFLIVLFTTKYMSLASMSGAAMLVASSFYFWWMYRPMYLSSPNDITLIFVVIAALLVIIRHSSNIKRLLAGTENKFSLSKKKEASDGNHSRD